MACIAVIQKLYIQMYNKITYMFIQIPPCPEPGSDPDLPLWDDVSPVMQVVHAQSGWQHEGNATPCLLKGHFSLQILK